MTDFIKVRSERLKQIQDPKNHVRHNTIMIDCNNDKVFDIPWCDDCKTVLMSPELD